MQKIDRSGVPCPKSLRADELREALREIKEHYDLPKEIRLNRRTPFQSKRLINEDVKISLNFVFKGKCAYCESIVENVEKGIDHFRPTSNASDLRRKYSPDHYGWFAYEWQNLMVACKSCLMSKGGHFPVLGPRAPLLCTWDEANNSEDARLLNPCVDDPLVHFRLHKNGSLIYKTNRGETTISVIGLNRQELLNYRCLFVGQFSNQLLHLQNDEIIKKLIDSTVRSGIGKILILSIYDFFPKPYRKWRINSSSINRVLPVLLESTPLNVWFKAFNEYEQKLVPQTPNFLKNSKIPPRYPKEPTDDRLASRYVTSVSLSNFKGFKNFTFKMPQADSSFQAPCAILLGENSTGKSTLLQALCLALMGPESLKKMGLDYSLFLSREKSNWHMIERNTASVEVEFDIGSKINVKIDSDTSTLIGDGSPPMMVLAYGARRYFRDGHGDERRNAATNLSLFNPLATISDPTIWLQKCNKDQFSAVARAMHEVLALKQSDHIFRDDYGNVQIKAHGRATPIHQMSDGYKSLLSMAIDIMRRMVERWGNLEKARGIVLIDEVETHLHPRWKMQVMGALRRAMPQVQFIVTTHDPLCLRGMYDGEVHVFARDAEDEIIQLESLPSVIGLRTEQLLTSDYFGLASTSDPELEGMIHEYESLAGGRNGYQNAPLIDKIKNQISDITIIGDTESEQIVSEALARYLVRARTRSADRSAMREDAIQEILNILNSSLRELS